VNRSDDREQAIERLLRQSLKTTPAGATDACLDAETLAAWADGGLSSEELESAQLHVADCVRCQAMVAGVVRSAASAPVSERPPRRWLAWLVPLTAATAAVAIWVAVPRGPAPQPMAENENRAAQEKAEPAAPITLLPEPTTAAKEGRQAPAAKGDQAPRDQPQASGRRKDADRSEVDLLKRESQAASGAAALSDNAAATTAAASPAQAPAAPAPTVAPAARQAFQTRSATNAASEKLAAAGVVISPDPTIRWRISATGLEHSTDGGATWDSIATGVSSSLTAIAAPSTTVCWVVGRSGVVLRTTDGRIFSRVTFPEMTDLSSVQATDARSATVTAIDGRVFTTADGGGSWSRR
jgi:hypothetical protein